MKRKSSSIQARNTILVRDIADKLSAMTPQPASKFVTLSAWLELVSAARGFGSYAAYTQAVKDNAEPADVKKTQLWLVDPEVVDSRSASLGLAHLLNVYDVVDGLRIVVKELMERFPDGSLKIELEPAAFFEVDTGSIVFDALGYALNPAPKTRDDLANRDLDLTVDENELSVARIGPLPDKVGGWLRASFTGQAIQDDSRGEYADPDDEVSVDFTTRVRLQRTGKQLYSGCKAEILTLYGHAAGSFKPDPDTDPGELDSTKYDDMVR